MASAADIPNLKTQDSEGPVAQESEADYKKRLDQAASEARAQRNKAGKSGGEGAEEPSSLMSKGE